jgi:uncharacterized protein
MKNGKPNKPTARASDQALSDFDIANLADITAALAVDDDALDLEGVDGFLTALICGPVSVSPDDYLPVMFGGQPAFDSHGQYQTYLKLLTRRGQMIERALAAPVDDLNDPRALVPILLDDESADADTAAPPGAYWAAGFMRVLEHWERDWRLLDPQIDSALSPHLDAMLTLCLPPEDWPEDLQPESDEPAEWLAQAIWAAYSMYAFWQGKQAAR